MQVTATREPRAVFTVPAAITSREISAASRDRAGINLSDALHGIPGVVARERQNYAQDLQVSIRGFGTRATFGIRGVRLLLDGMPLTMPDGQGQVSNLPLSALERVEVLRGPASLLYGNAAGGVLQAFTASGRDEPGFRVGARLGAEGLHRESLDARATGAALDAHVNLTHLRVDGFRDHGRAERSLLHARFGLQRAGLRATLVVNGLDQPLGEDPLGLDAAQWRENPRQSAPQAIQFDTRKTVRHQQAGLILEPADANAGGGWRLLAYGGTRAVRQFLAVPVGAQASPTSGGGVIDLHSRFGGLDLRLTRRWQVAGRDLTLVAGLAVDRQDQHRLGFENFIGERLGVIGRLRRDQDDRVGNQDAYLQADWAIAPRWDLQLGWRRSQVEFHSRDHYVAEGNPDDSGQRRFLASSPAVGLGWQPRDGLFVYASWGRGFETPTFDELGYRADGGAGLNFDLDAARNTGMELGARGRHGDWQWQASVFENTSDAELVVVANSGGRSRYANAGAARRRGIEAAVQWAPGAYWRHELAWTRLDARTLDSFLTCSGIPCRAPTTPVPAGTRLPGTPRDVLWWASRWQGERWQVSLEAEAVGPVTANTVGSAIAPGHAVVDVVLARTWGEERRVFLRLGNAFDRSHVGSVIVNEGNGRYFEPAPGREWLLGVDWRW